MWWKLDFYAIGALSDLSDGFAYTSHQVSRSTPKVIDSSSTNILPS